MISKRIRQWIGPAMIGVALSLPAVADRAPGFSEVEFETTHGGLASLSDYHGQVVILNLWAVWCSPCLMEIPHLVALQTQLPEGEVTVIGLAIDSGSASAINRFWQRRLDITPNYPLWMGTAEQAREWFDARLYPTTLIIDREGQVRQTLVGLQTEQDFHQALAAID
jgi:thiol-disulfide isomerase/thioredoxin